MTDDVIVPCFVPRPGSQTTALAFVECSRLPSLVSRALLRDDCPPVSSAHLNSLRAYLVGRPTKDLFLGTVTLGATGGVELQGSDQSGWTIVIRDVTRVRIIDGQHRLAAIAGNARARRASTTRKGLANRLGDLTVPILFLLNLDDRALDQAVADAHRDMPPPEALIAPFDHADALNGATSAIIERSALKGFVDRRTPTLQRRGRALFVFSNVRSFVVELAGGAEAEALALLSNPASRSSIETMAVELLALLNVSMEPWPMLLDPNREVAGDRMAELRHEHLNLTGAGLIAIGRAASLLAQNVDNPERQQRWARIAALDWRRKAELWRPLGSPNPTLGPGDSRLALATELILRAVQ